MARKYWKSFKKCLPKDGKGVLYIYRKAGWETRVMFTIWGSSPDYCKHNESDELIGWIYVNAHLDDYRRRFVISENCKPAVCLNSNI